MADAWHRDDVDRAVFFVIDGRNRSCTAERFDERRIRVAVSYDQHVLTLMFAQSCTLYSQRPKRAESAPTAAEDEENDQVAAEDSAGGDLMAMATPGSRTGSFKPATLEDFRAATQDKLVVILPSGWQGSVPQLLAALEKNADAAEVLILSQDDDADANEDDDEEQ